MAELHGKFQWYELMTTDPEAAQAFYKAVLGWGTQATPMTDMKYTLFTAGEKPVAGVMELCGPAREAGAPPGWLGYVGADDVDQVVEHVKRLGGAVHMPPADIPDVGRFAVVADPQLATFGVIKWGDPSMNAESGMGVPARTGWHELLTTDWPKALEFYGALFGWNKGEAVDMGAMGIYQLFAKSEHPMGGMFNKPPQVPATHWQYYFNVGPIDEASARVSKAGGKIANGPMEVPGGMWILNCIDPQGAMFSLLGSKPAG